MGGSKALGMHALLPADFQSAEGASYSLAPLGCAAGYRFRPDRNGFGRDAPLAGRRKNSATDTDSALAKRSKRSIVGFAASRSSSPT